MLTVPSRPTDALKFFRYGISMANVTVIGAQWGDEGKGKIIDWLANRADMVVRFQGGNNAGHTIVVGDKTYKLSLLPSGVVQGKRSIIGNGVVVDPWSLLEEIARVAPGRPRHHAGHAGAGRECRAGAAAAPRAGRDARGRGQPETRHHQARHRSRL